jgi:hypothetical protein
MKPKKRQNNNDRRGWLAATDKLMQRSFFCLSVRTNATPNQSRHGWYGRRTESAVMYFVSSFACSYVLVLLLFMSFSLFFLLLAFFERVNKNTQQKKTSKGAERYNSS